jgi:hypothetical protein
MREMGVKECFKFPSGKIRQRQKLSKDPENIDSEKIGKTWQTLKNT